MRISDWSSDVCSSDLFLQLLAFGNKGADAGLGVETGNARAARAHAFRQRSLRAEFQLKLARQILALELLVLTNIGTDHFTDLARAQQLAQALAIRARIIRRDGEILHPRDRKSTRLNSSH